MYGPAQTYENTARHQEQESLILDHLEFVGQVFGKLAARLPAGTDTENLEAAGVLGLVEAARRFDRGLGISFKTYAYPRIRGAMLDELRRNSPLPQPMMEKIARLRSAYERLPPPVAPEALAEAAGLSLNEVDQCLEAVRLTQPQPWNDLLSTVHERWKPDTSDPQGAAEKEEAKQLLADGIERLPEQERIVITLYYQENLRQKEIAQVIQRSESQVCKLLSRAEFHLKEYVRTQNGP